MEHLGPEADLREEILEGVSRAAVLDMLRKLLSVNQGNLLVSRQSGPHDSVRLKLLRCPGELLVDPIASLGVPAPQRFIAVECSSQVEP